MPETLEAIAIIAVAVLPGALATLAYERHVGTYAADIQERLIRFAASSALLFPVNSTLIWLVWTKILNVSPWVPSGQHRNLLASNSLEGAQWLVILTPIAYVLVPAILGDIGGRLVVSYRKREYTARTGRLGTGHEKEAWNTAFLDASPLNAPAGCIVRFRLKTGGWRAGYFGKASVASPTTKDVYFEATAAVDGDGNLIVEPDGRPVRQEVGILVRWDEVDFIEFVKLEQGQPVAPKGAPVVEKAEGKGVT